MGKTFGLEIDLLSPGEIKERWPLLEVGDVVGGIFLPKDGQTNPIDTTLALAKGAKHARRPDLREHARDCASWSRRGGRSGVATARWRDRAPTPSCSAAACGRTASPATAGAAVPLHAAEHFYIVTEPIAGLPRRPAGAARPGRMRVLQGGRRQDPDGLLRAGGQAVGHGRHSRGILLRHAAGGPRALRADPRGRGRAACRRSPTPASSCSSTGRRASRRTTATTSARRPRCRTCSSPPASTRSASPRAAAPARCWPNGSSTGARRSTCATSTSAA